MTNDELENCGLDNNIIKNTINSNKYISKLFILIIIYYILIGCLTCTGKKILKYANISTDGGSMSFQWVCISATVSLYVSFLSLYTHGYFFNFYYDDKYNFDNAITMFSMLVAYFLYDMTMFSLNTINIIHHLAGIIPIISIILLDATNYYKVAELMMITETSTIFLNMRTITEKKYKKIMNYIFGVSFLIFRTLFLPRVAWYCWLIIENNISGYISISTILTFLALNSYWTYMLIKKLIRECF